MQRMQGSTIYTLRKMPELLANTNQALPYARGEYIGLLDHDDVLTPDALYEMADAITKANDRCQESHSLIRMKTNATG